MSLKRIITILLVLTMLFSTVCAEGVDLSGMTLEGLWDLFTTAQSKFDKSEPALIETAINALKSTWLEKAYNVSISDHGYLEIVHARITYIKEHTDREWAQQNASDLFSDVYCIVEFVLLSDYYGSAPYYMDVNLYNNVVISRDGTVSVKQVSPFKIYSGRTYSYDYSDLIESIHDFGSEYNAVFHLLDP